MGTLKAKIAIDTSDLNTTTINQLYEKDLTVTKGGILVGEIDATTVGASVVLLAAADHASGTKVYIRNKHASNTLNINFNSTTQSELQLKAGEFAFFPWTGSVDIKAWASAVDTTIEYGTFA
jgi:hypothetical protein